MAERCKLCCGVNYGLQAPVPRALRIGHVFPDLAARKTLASDRRVCIVRMHPTLLLEGGRQLAAAAFLHAITRSQF